jgi:hydrogenase 3 maturation protease
MDHAMANNSWKKEARKAIGAARRIAVLGVGNPDKGDDGAGMAAAAVFKARLSPAERRRIRVFLGGTVPENLTGRIRAFGPDLVIVLDAALGGRRPGTLFRVSPDQIADDGISTHRISLRWLVRYVEESIGSPVLVLGIQPKGMDIEGKIAVPVEKGISTAVEFLLKSLKIVRSSSA